MTNLADMTNKEFLEYVAIEHHCRKTDMRTLGTGMGSHIFRGYAEDHNARMDYRAVRLETIANELGAGQQELDTLIAGLRELLEKWRKHNALMESDAVYLGRTKCADDLEQLLAKGEKKDG